MAASVVMLVLQDTALWAGHGECNVTWARVLVSFSLTIGDILRLGFIDVLSITVMASLAALVRIAVAVVMPCVQSGLSRWGRVFTVMAAGGHVVLLVTQLPMHIRHMPPHSWHYTVHITAYATMAGAEALRVATVLFVSRETSPRARLLCRTAHLALADVARDLMSTGLAIVWGIAWAGPAREVMVLAAVPLLVWHSVHTTCTYLDMLCTFSPMHLIPAATLHTVLLLAFAAVLWPGVVAPPDISDAAGLALLLAASLVFIGTCSIAVEPPFAGRLSLCLRALDSQ